MVLHRDNWPSINVDGWRTTWLHGLNLWECLIRMAISQTWMRLWIPCGRQGLWITRSSKSLNTHRENNELMEKASRCDSSTYTWCSMVMMKPLQISMTCYLWTLIETILRISHHQINPPSSFPFSATSPSPLQGSHKLSDIKWFAEAAHTRECWPYPEFRWSGMMWRERG